MPSASMVAIEPPSPLLLADSAAITPSILPVPNESGSFDFRLASAYDNKLDTEEPTPGAAPIKIPIMVPRARTTL